jgi:hypothetical protein
MGIFYFFCVREGEKELGEIYTSLLCSQGEKQFLANQNESGISKNCGFEHNTIFKPIKMNMEI